MDINHFLGIPGLSFNIILEISKTKLEKINGPEISDFVQKIYKRGNFSYSYSKRKIRLHQL